MGGIVARHMASLPLATGKANTIVAHLRLHRGCTRMQVSGDIFVLGDGDCGQLGRGEDATEALRPAPSPVSDKKVLSRCHHPSSGLSLVNHYTAAQEAGTFGGVAGQACSFVCAQVTQVAGGGMHSVALTVDGEVWTTGVNDEGALGRETGARFCCTSSSCQGTGACG